LIGEIAQDLTLTRSYFEGSSSATSNTNDDAFVGLLNGFANPTISASASFCTGSDCQTSYRTTATDLKTESFVSGAGWDVDNVWCVVASLNDGFPVLRTITGGPFNIVACDPIVIPDTSGPGGPSLIRITLDPNGGACGVGAVRSEPQTIAAVGYAYLPGASDCFREEHEFVGWADVGDPTSVKNLTLIVDPADGSLRLFATQSMELVAVWRSVPRAEVSTPPNPPTVFVGIRNWLCRNCGVLLIWNRPSAGSSVVIVNPSGAPICSGSVASIGDWSLCHDRRGSAGAYRLQFSNAVGSSKPAIANVR
jgi:hypothetical protein